MIPIQLADAAPTAMMVVPVSQQSSSVNSENVIGFCIPIAGLSQNRSAGMSPGFAAREYLVAYQHTKVPKQDIAKSKVQFINLSSHGKISALPTSNLGPDWLYTPENDYFGTDRATAMVTVNGATVRVEYYLEVLKNDNSQNGSDGPDWYCKDHGVFWKISTTESPRPTTITYNYLQLPRTTENFSI